MSDLQGLLERTKAYVARAAKGIVANHKKKLIAGVVLLVAGYVVKRKMTMAHLITIIEALSKFVQYLPLPDAPKPRTLTPYEHPEPAPLRAILTAARIEEAKARVGRKVEGSWDELKEAILTGATLTCLLYNVNSFYFLLQNKYGEEFKQLRATEQFEQAMYLVRRQFTDELPRIADELRLLLAHRLHAVALQDQFSLPQLADLFQQLTAAALDAKFPVAAEHKKSIIARADKEVANLFTSPYEYSPPKPSSFLVRAASGVARLLGGTLRVFDWFPQAKQEPSGERYEWVRRAYLLGLLKAETEGVVWPSEGARGLWELVREEAGYMLLSLNFSVLVEQHCSYHCRVLVNRVRLWMAANRCSSAKTVKLLPALFKILQEEFLQANVYQQRDNYHEKELRRAVKQFALADQEELPEADAQEAVLGEIEAKKAFQHLEREFELKYFHERSAITHRPKKHDTEAKENKDMQKLLNMLGGSEALNQAD